MQTKVALHLDTLSCAEETEHGSEPYIWPIMIADEVGIPQIHVPTAQWEAKVLTNEMRAGQSVAIPPGMDLNLAHLFDDKAAGLIVVIVALFEKDASLQHGSVALIRHIEERSLLFVRERLTDCRQRSGDRGDLRQMLVSRLNPGQAENDALTTSELIKTFLKPGGFDDPVGLTVWTLSGQALTTRNISFDLSAPSERFTLTGTMEVSDVLPPRCQAERDAAARALAVVKSLQTQRALLQAQLHHATPQQKAAIVAQITRLAEVDQPAAELALAEADAALQACLDRFGRGTHGPIDPPVIR
jgi:hypothetical protein